MHTYIHAYINKKRAACRQLSESRLVEFPNRSRDNWEPLVTIFIMSHHIYHYYYYHYSLSLSLYIYIYHPIHVNIYRCTYAFLSDRADLPPVAITFRIIQLPSSSCHYFPNNSVAFLQLPLLSSSCLPPVAIIFLQLPSSSCHYFPPVAFLQLPLSSSNIYNPTEYTLFSILSDII